MHFRFGRFLSHISESVLGKNCRSSSKQCLLLVPLLVCLSGVSLLCRKTLSVFNFTLCSMASKDLPTAQNYTNTFIFLVRMTWFLCSAKQNECCLQIVLTPAIVSASAASLARRENAHSSSLCRHLKVDVYSSLL